MLERRSELGAASRARKQALAGDGSLLVLEGPPGIGKTRLLEEVTQRARGDGLVVMRARGGEFEQGFPYGIVRQLYEPALERMGPRKRGKLLAGAAASATPALTDDLASASQQGDSFAVANGLYWLTANLCELAPLALVIDDGHWADDPSIRFLIYLARRMQGLALLLVVAARPHEPGADSDLLDSLIASGNARVLHPAPLSESAVAKLIERGLRSPPEPAFAAACHNATAGNPFYIEALISSLRQDRITPTADKADAVLGARDATLSRAILLRLSRLPSEAAALAEALAVLGGEAELRELAALADLDLHAAALAADALARVELVSAERPLRFMHAIVRAAVYEEIPRGDRVIRHARAARVLAAQGASLDQIIEHLTPAEPTGDQWAVERLRAGGDDALRRGAAAIAVSRLRRALAEGPSRDIEPTLLRELATAEYLAGGAGPAIGHARRALELEPDPRERAQTAFVLRSALVSAGRPGDAIAELDAAIADVVGLDGSLADKLEIALLAAARLDVATSALAGERLEALRRRVENGDVDDPLSVSVVVAEMTRRGAWTAAQVADASNRVVRRYADAEPAPEQMFALLSFALALILSDRFEEARSALELVRADPLAQLTFGAATAFRQGGLAESEADARAAIAVCAERDERWMSIFAHATLVATLVERGELEHADRALEQFWVDPEESATFYGAWLLQARGQLRAAQGRLREGLSDLAESGSRLMKMRVECPAVSSWRTDAAVAHALLGEQTAARRLARQELDLARAFGAPRALGIALRTNGQLASLQHAPRLLLQSVKALEQTGAKLELARSLVALGAAVRRDNRPRDARPYLKEGLALARGCGAEPLVKQARAELAATGVRRISERPLSGPDALTPSEHRIAEMAAAGKQNKEIAQALFVTLKTVEVHLGSAFRKLDINSRRELRHALWPRESRLDKAASSV
jgi:DNA-binding CsgD family transcriptional regulator